jgi:hypothetical protein
VLPIAERRPVSGRTCCTVGAVSAQRRMAFLIGVRASRGAVVVVRGEPGISKTALPRHRVDRAPGFRVVRCVGIGSEMELAFAGLRELCDFQGRPLERRSFSAGLRRRFAGEIRGG